jgi:hypothetical protein
MPSPLTARDIENALRRRYLIELTGWALLREVTIEDEQAVDAWHRLRYAGLGNENTVSIDELTSPTRRIDVLLMRTAPSSKPQYERIAIEIKVSRSDFRRDTDIKRRAWQGVAHRFAYATPAGLIRPDEVPDGCGLIEVDAEPQSLPRSGVSWRVRAPRRKEPPPPMPDRFVAYLAGRASRAEHEIRKAA